MLDTSFRDTFSASLISAKETYKYDMSKQVEEYLTTICVDEFTKESDKRLSAKIDSLIFFDRLPSTPETLDYLKHNGDYYFTLGGYAPEAFCSKKIEMDYYLSIGKYSYFRLHQRIPRDTLYKTLAYDYMPLTYILNETFDAISLYKESQILKAWDAYSKTKHQIFKKKLIRMGMDVENISC